MFQLKEHYFGNYLYVKNSSFQSYFAMTVCFVFAEPDSSSCLCTQVGEWCFYLCSYDCSRTLCEIRTTHARKNRNLKFCTSGATDGARCAAGVTQRSNLRCYYYPLFVFSLFAHVRLYCLINESSSRPFPAAWAPANFSPVALPHTNHLSAKRWRFTVCWLWINTPLKVRWSIWFDLT